MLNVEDTALIVIDVQGKLAEIVDESDFILRNIETLIKGAKILNIPIVYVEQYPEGLGPTVEQLQRHLEGAHYVKKRTFSAFLEDSFVEMLAKLNRHSLLIAGIESHVCVYQTVRDLLKQSYNVEVVADGVSSRTAQNRQIGIERMKAEGASITSTEMVLFDLMKTSTNPQFREISALIK